MGLDEVKKDIVESTREEIKKIEQATKQAIQEIEATNEKQIQEITVKIEQEIKVRIGQIQKTKIAEAQGTANNLIVAKKRELIDTLLSEAKKNLTTDKNLPYLKTLLARAGAELSIGRVICNMKDMQLIQNAGFKAIASNEIDGGFIAENKDGTISVDYTFDTILATIRDNHLQEMAKALFK